LQKTPASPEYIQLLSFYSHGVKMINLELRKREILDVVVKIVNNRQGSEAPIVIVHTVGATGQGHGVGKFVRNFERLNVAMSRSRYLCVVVGNFESWQWATESLQWSQSANDTVKRFVAFYQAQGSHSSFGEQGISGFVTYPFAYIQYFS
jgi:hypothetical protein